MRFFNVLGVCLALSIVSCDDRGIGNENQNNGNQIDPLDVDGDGSPVSEDCDDNDPERFPGNPEPPNSCGGILVQNCGDGIDQDCDGLDTRCFVDDDCDGSPPEFDCDDQNAAIFPGANEICDNDVDDNCNDMIDEGCVHCDLDGDGYQRVDAWSGCPTPDYPVGQPPDCDDRNAGIFPAITDDCDGQEGGHPTCTAYQLCDGLDNDCDGTVDEGCPSLTCDVDQDGFMNTTAGCNPPAGEQDCNDADPNVYPGAPDLCGDGIVQNCNVVTPCNDDTDGDGYNSGVDCDDDDVHVFPGAIEVCNGIDDDCDGLVDEGNPSPSGVPMTDVYCNDDNDGVCGDPSGPGHCICSGALPSTQRDGTNRQACSGEDLAAPSSPRCFFAPAPEMEQCDTLDHDCDGNSDDPTGANLQELGSPCGTDSGACVAGTVVGCDLDQTNPAAFNPYFLCSTDFVGPVPELCNGVDDDCNGVLPSDELDQDGDGYLACTGCEGLTLPFGVDGCDDCAPQNPSRHPGATEQCNGVDDNCSDGLADDGADQCGGATEDCCASLSLCVDLGTNFDHCGDCASPCNPFTASLCSGEECLCGSGPPCTGNLQCVGTGAAATCQ